jgi:hypothetical protein
VSHGSRIDTSSGDVTAHSEVHGVERRARVRRGEQARLGFRFGIPDAYLEEEAIELRLGQGIRPLVLDRILRGEDREIARQCMALAVDGDRALLHRLEERRLRLRRRAVDLVAEQEVGEDRAVAEREAAFVRTEHARARDVGGHQVGRELHAGVARAERGRERADEQRLRHAGRAFHQAVSAGQDRHERGLDLARHPDHGATHFFGEA